jgi:hypothetical protein
MSAPRSVSSGSLTRGMSKQVMEHLVDNVISKDNRAMIRASLEYEKLMDFVRFRLLDDEQIDDLEVKSNKESLANYLPKQERRELKLFVRFVNHLYSKDPNRDWFTVSDQDYEQYLLNDAPAMGIKKSGGSSTSETLKFQSNVKLDVKLYPTFDGDINAWLKFKRGVLSLAATHGLEEVFDKNFIVPKVSDSGQDWLLYEAKNKFVYSIWTARVFGSYPLTIIRAYESTKDGRAVYFKFLEYYECANNMEQVSLLAMTKLQELKLLHTTKGGLPAYITKFRDAILDLEEAGKPMDPTLQKSMFLSKIHDREYKNMVDMH